MTGDKPSDETLVAPASAGTVDHPLARLLAGGRHIRLLVFGPPPPALALPPLDRCERVVWLVRRGDPAAGPVVADPERLPFVEAVFDRLLVTTLLPSDAGRAELRELWRILAPAGLALLVVKARRRWQVGAPGWRQSELRALLADAMFDELDWRIETLPDRWHLVLVGKADGLRPEMIGRVSEAFTPAPA